MSPTPPHRDHIRDHLRTQEFDLVILGGGINGAAVARDATMRGLKVALLEQRDFAFGTSSRSSRLIHGGLRYLEHAELGLVFESVSERHQLSMLARHLVRPMPFVFPVIKGGESLLKIDIGLWIYDTLALFRNYRMHKALRPAGIQAYAPTVDVSKLKGAIHYYDYQTDDARLVLENILSAVELGATALSYARVERFDYEGGRVRAVRVHDAVANDDFQVRGRAVLVTAGPWTDEVLGMTGPATPLLRPTKGVHIVIPREKFPLEAALVLRHPTDGRVLFGIPYYERTVVGTTDTDFHGDPAAVRTTAEDVQYLFAAVKRYAPRTSLAASDVIATWAGVRPLLSTGHKDGPSAVSREHLITQRPDGLFLMAGGKLTTYRRMAEECVDFLVNTLSASGVPLPRVACQTGSISLPGSVGLDSEATFDSLIATLTARVRDEKLARHLATTYGVRSNILLDSMEGHPSLFEKIDPELPYLWGEIRYATTHGLALTLSDALVRRTKVYYRALDQGLACSARAAEIMGEVLGWSAEERARQRTGFEEVVEQGNIWRRQFETSASEATDPAHPHGVPAP